MPAVQLAFSWAFLLEIFNKTKQSDQRGFLFLLLLWHLIHNLFDGLKIQLIRAEEATQSCVATANTSPQ